MAKKYWLMKSEPDVFSIDDLKKIKRDLWDGVRNYQARNFMMREMKVGDEVLFYHSNTKLMGVYGLARISKEAVEDLTQFDKKSKYFDEKASPERPRWYCVEVEYKAHFDRPVSLQEIKETKALKDMLVIQKGQRLSIQPVTKKEFDIVCKMSKLP